MNFQNVLRTRRKQLDYTLKEVAEKVGVTEATVQRWESGNIKNLRHERLSKLAEVLEIHPAVLMGWIEDSNVLGNKIKSLRKSRELSPEELSLELNSRFNLNIDCATINKWESGLQKPLMNSIIGLAKFFNVSIDYLNGNEISSPPSDYPSPKVTEDYTTFPVFGDIAAGYENIAIEEWDGELIDIPNSYLKGRSENEFMVLRVKGSSMYPTYQDGDKVLILKQSTLNYSGQIGAVLYDNEYATLKRVEYVLGEDWMRLVPINPNYEPELIEGERLEGCRIIGIPKLLIREISH